MYYSFLIFFYLLSKNLCNCSNLFINDFGGSSNGESDVLTAQNNGVAFSKMIKSSKPNDTIYILKNETIYYIPDQENPFFSNLTNITIIIDGKIILHDNNTMWPMYNDLSYYNAFDIRDSNNVNITGSGTIDGQGYNWWKDFLLHKIVRQRPTIININDSINISISRLYLHNSPRFNIYCDNVLYAEISLLTIWVDVIYQKNILQSFKIPIFPFNTDGIDVKGKFIHIHDINISNYDDTVCVKPSKNTTKKLNNLMMDCSSNILVENIIIHEGAGISIGSVSSSHMSCIKNVTYRKIVAYNPLKLIYVKTGAIDNAETYNAIIENITYIDIRAYNPILWPIYIGPQQQKEPDGTGDGIWPVTNPFVNISNIYISDIIVENAYSKPGIIRCNNTNPCKNIKFNSVQIKYKNYNDFDNRYICDDDISVYGSYDSRTHPSISNCGLTPSV